MPFFTQKITTSKAAASLKARVRAPFTGAFDALVRSLDLSRGLFVDKKRAGCDSADEDEWVMVNDLNARAKRAKEVRPAEDDDTDEFSDADACGDACCATCSCSAVDDLIEQLVGEYRQKLKAVASQGPPGKDRRRKRETLKAPTLYGSPGTLYSDETAFPIIPLSGPIIVVSDFSGHQGPVPSLAELGLKDTDTDYGLAMPAPISV